MRKLLLLLLIWNTALTLLHGQSVHIEDPPVLSTITSRSKTEKTTIVVYYRWDNDTIDNRYLHNAETLTRIDSLFRSDKTLRVDSLHIAAYASPEGNPFYNIRLSERRAESFKKFLITTYPQMIDSTQISTLALGENWEGFYQMAIEDTLLPLKRRVLSILTDSTINNEQRQSQIESLDGGELYKRYLLPRYYRYLRNGVSLLEIYTSSTPSEPLIRPETALKIGVDSSLHREPDLNPTIHTPDYRQTERHSRYPIALRSNLLYDVIGGWNIGVEVPLGPTKNWSILVDFAYAYLRTSNHLYAFQTIEYGIEARRWFPASRSKGGKQAEWAKPLRGWNVGIYGTYCSRYDIQWIDGYQGDGFWSAGLTAGYAFPFARNWSFEVGIGAGYWYTPEYRHYHRPKTSPDGKPHLLWEETGSFGTFTLTKLRLSIVWLLPISKK